MPALQIRECPENIYDGVKRCSKVNRRSMANEALIALEEYVARQERDIGTPVIQFENAPNNQFLSFNEDMGREERIAKRKALFERIDNDGIGFVASPQEVAQIIKEERGE